MDQKKSGLRESWSGNRATGGERRETERKEEQWEERKTWAGGVHPRGPQINHSGELPGSHA